MNVRTNEQSRAEPEQVEPATTNRNVSETQCRRPHKPVHGNKLNRIANAQTLKRSNAVAFAFDYEYEHEYEYGSTDAGCRSRGGARLLALNAIVVARGRIFRCATLLRRTQHTGTRVYGYGHRHRHRHRHATPSLEHNFDLCLVSFGAVWFSSAPTGTYILHQQYHGYMRLLFFQPLLYHIFIQFIKCIVAGVFFNRYLLCCTGINENILIQVLLFCSNFLLKLIMKMRIRHFHF